MAGIFKVLLVGPRPRDLEKMSTKDEIRGIRSRVNEMGERLDLIEHLGSEFNDLPGLLVRHDPDVLHITAHGAKEGFLAFEDARGESHAVPIEALRMLLRAHVTQGRLSCVVLNSCEMDVLASSLTELVSFIVASPNALFMEASIAFSEIFYQMLSVGKTVELAFGMAHAASQARAGEGGTYKLYSRGDKPPLDMRPNEIFPKLSNKPTVYINAVPNDARYVNELKVGLKPYVDRGVLEVWDPSMTSAGSIRDEEARSFLGKANIVLLFLSAAAMADDEWTATMAQAINQQTLRATRVVPIQIRPVITEGAPFAKLQKMPRGPKALSAFGQHEREEQWQEIVGMIVRDLKGTARN
jgi:hypothetical protein